MVPEGVRRFTFERNLALLRVWPSLCDSRWLYFCLRSQFLQDQIRLGMGFSAQPGIYLGALADLRLPLPHLDEQRSLVAKYQDMAQESADTRRLLDQSTSLLQERKQALITAAVTGQFDVTTTRSVA